MCFLRQSNFKFSGPAKRLGGDLYWIPHEISEVQQWHSYAVTHALLDRYQWENNDFLGRIIVMDEIWAHSCEPNLKCQLNECKHPASPLPKKVRSTQYAVKVMFIVAWDTDGDNTAPCCTSKADGKCCLLLHVPATSPLSSAQEKTLTLGDTEPHHSSWQCKESHSGCCHEPLAPLAMGDSGTSTILTWYEAIQLWSLRQSERTTARDPVNTRDELIHAIGQSIRILTKIYLLMVYDSFHNLTKVINNGRNELSTVVAQVLIVF